MNKKLIEYEPPLVVMVGLPYSGKTTIANGWYRTKGYTIVCPDDFRLAIHGERFISSAEPFVWACVYASVDALLRSGNRVVVDATNISEKRRSPWVERGAAFRLVDTPESLCIARAQKSEDEQIIPVIERMALEYEPPVIGVFYEPQV